MSAKRILVISTTVLLLLLILCIAGFYYAKNLAIESAVQKAKDLGWELDLGEVKLDWNGTLTLKYIEATNASKGSIRLDAFKTELSFQNLWNKQLPERLDCETIHAELYKENLTSIYNLFVKNKADLQKNSKEFKENNHKPRFATTIGVNHVFSRFHNENKTFEFNGEKLELQILEKEIKTHGLATLIIPESKYTNAAKHTLKFSLNLTLNEQNYRSSIELTPPLAFQLKHKHETYQAQFANSELEISKDFSNSSILVQNLEVTLPNSMPIKNTEIQALQAHIERKRDKEFKIKTISLKQPKISLDLFKLFEKPEFAEYALNEAIQTYTTPKRPETPTSKRSKSAKQNPQQITTKKITSEQIQSVKNVFFTLKQTISQLPSLFIEDGSFELQWKEYKFSIQSLSFDTANMLENDNQNFAFAFHLRGADASFQTHFPENQNDFPELTLHVKNLALTDLFALTTIPKPEQLTGFANAALKITGDEQEIMANIETSLVDFGLFHTKISSKPIQNVQLSSNFQLYYSFDKDELTLRPFRITSEPVTIELDIEIQKLRSNPVLSYKIWSNPIPCEDIPKAIPQGLLPTIDELEFSGTTLKLGLKGKWPFAEPIKFTFAEDNFACDCFIKSIEPHHPEVLNDPLYTFTFTEYTTVPEGITVGPGTNAFTPLEKIPPYVRAAMFLTEDKRFFDHGPIRPSFIERAMRLNIENKRYVYGGSTISQQLVKNLFLSRNKNLARKIEEVFIAWSMEERVSKERIFELYINMIEFGPDIYGITTASSFYFNKTPKELNPVEGAFLASLKVAPSKGARFYRQGFPLQNSWWNKRIKYILQTLAENGYIAPMEIIQLYPWIPVFYKPDPADKTDFRNKWLQNHKP